MKTGIQLSPDMTAYVCTSCACPDVVDGYEMAGYTIVARTCDRCRETPLPHPETLLPVRPIEESDIEKMRQWLDRNKI